MRIGNRMNKNSYWEVTAMVLSDRELSVYIAVVPVQVYWGYADHRDIKTDFAAIDERHAEYTLIAHKSAFGNSDKYIDKYSNETSLAFSTEDGEQVEVLVSLDAINEGLAIKVELVSPSSGYILECEDFFWDGDKNEFVAEAFVVPSKTFADKAFGKSLRSGRIKLSDDDASIEGLSNTIPAIEFKKLRTIFSNYIAMYDSVVKASIADADAVIEAFLDSDGTVRLDELVDTVDMETFNPSDVIRVIKPATEDDIEARLLDHASEHISIEMADYESQFAKQFVDIVRNYVPDYSKREFLDMVYSSINPLTKTHRSLGDYITAWHKFFFVQLDTQKALNDAASMKSAIRLGRSGVKSKALKKIMKARRGYYDRVPDPEGMANSKDVKEALEDAARRTDLKITRSDDGLFVFMSFPSDTMPDADIATYHDYVEIYQEQLGIMREVFEKAIALLEKRGFLYTDQISFGYEDNVIDEAIAMGIPPVGLVMMYA